MADRFWRGGTGTWNTTSTTNWSATSGGAGGASVPTTADSVFFDQAGTYTVTMTGALACLDITVSAGTVSFATGTTPSLNVRGNMSLLSNTVWLSSGTTTFTSTTTATINVPSPSYHLGPITFNGVGCNFSLSTDLSIGGTNTITLTNGTLTLNNFNMSCGTFSSSNTNTRSIAFGSGVITTNHGSTAQQVLSMQTATNFTWTGTGGFACNASITRTLAFGTTAGGTTTNAPNMTLTGSGTAVITVATGCWFNKLDFGTTAFNPGLTTLNLNSLTLSTGGTYASLSATFVSTGTFTPNAKAIAALVINNGAGTTTLAGAASCTTYSQTAGTIDFATFNLTCSNAATYISGTQNNISTITCLSFIVNSSTNTFTFSSGTIATGAGGFTITTGTFVYNGGTITVAGLFTHTAGTLTLNASLTIGVSSTYSWAAGTININGFTLSVGQFSSVSSSTRAINFGTNGSITMTITVAAASGINMSTATGFTWSGTGGFYCNAATTRTHTFGTTGGNSTNAPNLTLTGSGTAVQTFTTGSFFNKVDFGTTAFTLPATTLSLGAFTLSTGGTFTGLTAQMVGTGIITPNGKPIALLTVNNVAGTTTLAGALSVAATATTSLTSGTLDLAGFTLTTGIFNSNNASVRSLKFGSGTIAMAHTTAGTTVLAMGTVTNFTWTGTGGFTTDASITRTLQVGNVAGGSITTAPNLTLTGSGTAVITLTTTSSFNTLSFGTTAFNPGTTTLNLNSLTLSSGGTFTGLTASMWGTGTITSNTNTTLGALTINITSGTTTLAAALTLTATGTTTLTSGTLDLAGFTLTTGIFSSSNTNTRSIAFGAGNIVLAHTTATTTVLAMTTVTGYTYTGTATFTTNASVTRTLVFGTTGGSVTNAPNITLTGSGTSVITFTNGSYFNKLDFGTTAFDPGSTSLLLSALTLSSSGTYTTFPVTFIGTGTFTSNGKTVAAITVNNSASSGTVTVSGAVSGSSFTMTSGTIDFAFNNLTLSGTANYTDGTLNNISTITCTTFNVSGTFTLTQGTITPSVSFVVLSGAFNYNGGTLSAVPTFTQTSGNVTLGQSYALTATGTYSLTAGTLDLGGFTLTTGIFSSSNTLVRSISFGSSNIVLAHTTAGTQVLSMPTATNFTYTGTGGFVSDASITRTFNFGTTSGSATNSLNVTLTGSGSAAITLISGSYFNKFDFGTTTTTVGTTSVSFNGLTLSSGGTFTNLTATMVGTGTITPNGKTIAELTINSVSGTTTLAGALSFATATATVTLTSGTLDLAGFTLTTGIFSSSNINTRSISFGAGNIVLAHTTAGTTVLSMANATNFTWTGTGGFTTDASITRTVTFGTTSGSANISPNMTLTGSGTSVITFTTGSWFNTLNFGTTAFSVSTTTLNLNSLILSTSGTYTSLTATIVGNGSITSNGKTIAALTINFPGRYKIYEWKNSGSITFPSSNAPPTVECLMVAGGGGSIPVNGLAATGGGGAGGLYYGSVNVSNIEYTITVGAGGLGANNGDDSSLVIASTSTDVVRTYGGGYGGAAGGGAGNSGGSGGGGGSTAGPAGPALQPTSTWGGYGANGSIGGNGVSAGRGGGAGADGANGRSFNIPSSATYYGGAGGQGRGYGQGGGQSVPYLGGGGWGGGGSSPGGLPTAGTPNTGGGAGGQGGNLTGNVSGGSGIVILRYASSYADPAATTGTPTLYLPVYSLLLNDALTVTNTTTLTEGVLDLNGFTLTTGIFSSNTNTVRSIVFGTSNIVLSSATPGTTVLDMATATGFTWTGTGGFTTAMSVTRTIVFGTTDGSATNSPNLSLTGSGTSIGTFTTGSWFNTLNFGTTAFAVPSTTLNVNNITLSTGGTYTSLTATMVDTGTVTPNGKSMAALTVNNLGTTTLAGALTTTTSTTLTSGTLALAGFTLTPTQFISGGPSTRAISGSGTGIISLANDWTVTDGTGFTGSDYIINMTKATSKTFAGAGGTYGTLVQAGTGLLTITGSNSFADIRATTRPSTITFTAGTTQTVNEFSLAGTAGNLVTINSTISGTQFTLSKSSGTVTVSYLSIKDSNVTGGADWYNNNGTNTVLTNNTGWSGIAPVSAVNGQFMAFF